MNTSLEFDIMRLVVRGALDLLLHDNADIVEILREHNREDLIQTINTFEASYMWLKKHLDAEAEMAN
jgi:hypothetical protein